MQFCVKKNYWLLGDDFSIKFLNASSIHNRKCNHILSLRNSVGNWTMDLVSIRDFTASHFLSIYTISQHYAPFVLAFSIHLDNSASGLVIHDDSPSLQEIKKPFSNSTHSKVQVQIDCIMYSFRNSRNLHIILYLISSYVSSHPHQSLRKSL